jgi:signal peptidase II
LRFLRPAIVVSLILLLDQSIKFWIKLHFTYNESKRIFNWFYLYFIENEGMAFGMSLGGDSGKLLLTLFRIIAAVAIGYYLIRVVNQKAHPGFIVAMALIFAGAVGNILDSVFYGKIFSMSSPTSLSVLFPAGGGYANWLHGRVVDMFYFPLYEGFLPKWIPVWGGDYFIFFRPIFNIADASITTGVLMIIVFQKKFFRDRNKKIEDPISEIESPAVQTDAAPES